MLNNMNYMVYDYVYTEMLPSELIYTHCQLSRTNVSVGIAVKTD